MSIHKERDELFVVPWSNAKQFKKVYECVYSPELDKKRWALDQISVWESRCHPSLPAAIEATYGLTSAIVQDIIWTSSLSLLRQLDIQYMYSSAITRFVNLTVELHNKSGTCMSTMAKGLGIPSYIIDLRNEASHSMRPSLSCLRIAADTAMKFLKEAYWDIESSKVENYIQNPIDVTNIEQLLQQFLEAKLHLQCVEKTMQEEIDVEKRKIRKEIKKILLKIETCIEKHKRLFIEVLTSEGVFIPNDIDFKKFVDEEEYSEFLKDEDPMNYIVACDTSILVKVPSSHENAWLEVLTLLNMYDAVPLFLEELLKTQGDKTLIGQKLLISWVFLIFRIHSAAGRYENSFLARLFKRKGIVVNWHSMFHAAVVNPCKYVAFIIPLIFSNLDVDKYSTQRILKLMAVYLGQAVDQNLVNSSIIFTVEKLKRSKKLQNGKIKETSDSEKNIWSLVSDDAYRTWPIGHVNNPIGQESTVEEAEKECYSFPVDDFKETFILGNENDEENIMDYETPKEDVLEECLEDDVLKEIQKRKRSWHKK